MSKRRYVDIVDPVFMSRTTIVWGCGQRSLLNWTTRRYNETFEWSSGSPEGLTLEMEDGALVVWVAEGLGPGPYQVALAHECLHGTFRIMRGLGITATAESEEAFTMLHSFLMSECQKAQASDQ